MSLRYALLALLSGREMTGYEVSRHFSQSTAHVWHAPDSQIYPELRRLAQDGLLEVDEVEDGGRGVKKRYRVTPAGLEQMRLWIESPTQPRRQRDPAYLKAAYLEWASPEAVRSLMKEHIAFHSEHLEMLEQTRTALLDGTHVTLRRRLERYAAGQHERIIAWKVFAYDGLIEQARQEIRWAERGPELVDRLEGGPLVQEDPPPAG